MIFLSHSWANKPEARKVVAALAMEGLPVWIDEHQLKLGEALKASCVAGVRSSGVFVYLASKESNQSRTVQVELSAAQKNGLEVIPVVISDEETELPPALDGSLYHSLDPSKGGAARLAHLLREYEGVTSVPENVALTAVLRLTPNTLVHSLDAIRSVAAGRRLRVFMLDMNYEPIDTRYWQLSEVTFSRLNDTRERVEAAMESVRSLHERSRRSITEIGRLCEAYLTLGETTLEHRYSRAGTLETIHALMHWLSWNCDYLSALRRGENVDGSARHLREPYDGHICVFTVGGRSIGTVNVPDHGHPFSGSYPPEGWGLSSPFSDLLPEEVGRAVGHLMHYRFLAGKSVTAAMPPMDELQYGLA